MKKNLQKITVSPLYHFVDKQKVNGKNENMSGDCSGLYGDCTRLSGDCSGLYGDCTWLYGDCTGLSGDCSGLSGNLNDCDLTDEDRRQGVDILDLVREESL